MIRNHRLFFSLFLLFLVLPLHQASGAQRRSPIVIAVEKVGPAVVNISTTVKSRVSPFFAFPGNDFFKDFFPEMFSRELTRTSLGSGVIIDGRNGYIVTNHHVISGASKIKVVTSDKKEYQAILLGSVPCLDLALLQVVNPEGLPEIRMGNSDDLMIGETVIAIGNPFGLSHTVTTGVVSAINRSVRAGDQVYRNFIQTDASINPGNSGGPLLNIEGNLIGINTAIYQKAQGIGFSIPINKAKRIIEELIQAGEVRFPWIGLEVQELTAQLRRFFGFQPERGGILVSDVLKEGPASGSGIKRGDILTAIEGVTIASLSDYREILGEFTPSDPLQLKIFRKGVEKTLSIKPRSFPLELALDLVDRRLGIRVRELSAIEKRRYGIQGGLKIKEVRQDSEAGKIGLRPGDLILKVNNRGIGTIDDFKKIISRNHFQPTIQIIVQRGSQGVILTLPF